jgi:hypothetical protein
VYVYPRTRQRREGPCRGFRAAIFHRAGTAVHSGAPANLRQAAFYRPGSARCSNVLLTINQLGFQYATTANHIVNVAAFNVNWPALPNVMLGLQIDGGMLLSGSGNAGVVRIRANATTIWRHTFPNDNAQHGPLSAAAAGFPLDPLSTFGIPEPVNPGLVGAPVSDQYTVPFMNPGVAGHVNLDAMGGGNLPPTAFQQSGFNQVILRIVTV